MLKVEKKWKFTKRKFIKKKFINYFINQTKELKNNGEFRCDVGYRYLKRNSEMVTF